MLKFISNNNIYDPRINLALEEYCLRTLDMNHQYLLFYVNEPSIIIGRNQNTIEEINSNYVREKNIHVVRRVSGGGAVYHDFGNLNFSFITRYDRDFLNNFKLFTEPVIKSLRSMGVPAELTGRNDIVAEGRKISGNAQYSTGKSMLSHGTLLFNSEIEAVVNALNVKMEKIESKGLKSVKSRVANISEFLDDAPDGPVTPETFRETLLDTIFSGEDGIPEQEITGGDWEKVRQLAESKYQSWEWNYGRSPAFNIQRVHRFDIGRIDARIRVEKGAMQEIKFFGDFLGHGDVADIENLLSGLRYHQDDIKTAVKAVDLQRYFGGIDGEAFISFLVD